MPLKPAAISSAVGLAPVLARLLVGELQTEQRLRHLVGRIGRRHVVAVGVDLMEPALELAIDARTVRWRRARQ